MPAQGRVLERSLTEEILYGRPSEELKVFLSSAMRGGSLASERAVAIQAIDAAALHRAWAWERDAHAGPYSSKVVCLANARTSDALVMIVGSELTRMTRQEYRAAKIARVPRFILVKEGVAQSPDVVRFIASERRHSVTNSFANEAELRTQVQSALRVYAVHLHRLGSFGGAPK